MSKIFIPQFSPDPDPSREFVNQGSSQGEGNAPPSSLEWPIFQFREDGLEWNRDRKEKEEKVLKQAKEKGLLIEKEAYEKGFSQGEKDGLELAQKRFETILDSFGQILKKMERLHLELYGECEKEIIQIISAITRKILRYDWPLPEGVVRENLRAAFEYVIEPMKIVVHLNPKDHQSLLTHPHGLPWSGSEGMDSIKIIPDPSVTRGGCFLETSFGEIDGRLESQLDHICSLMGSKVKQPAPLPDRGTP